MSANFWHFWPKVRDCGLEVLTTPSRQNTQPYSHPSRPTENAPDANCGFWLGRVHGEDVWGDDLAFNIQWLEFEGTRAEIDGEDVGFLCHNKPINKRKFFRFMFLVKSKLSPFVPSFVRSP